LPEPNNAIVVNLDGTINHQVRAPIKVERTIEAPPGKAPITKAYPVESIVEVLVQDDRVVFGLGFAYEWVERRYYSANQRHQGRIERFATPRQQAQGIFRSPAS
jgi:hypothetical protein